MSLVGFRARNHPQQPTAHHVDDRRTPREFFNELHERHRFTVDAAASSENALLDSYWSRESDALKLPGQFQRVWCNPPYSALAPWVAKAWREMLHGGCELVVMLLPANRCEQPFWQEYVEPFRDGEPRDGIRLATKFLPGRMRFGKPVDVEWATTAKKGHRPPFGCVLVTWGRP